MRCPVLMGPRMRVGPREDRQALHDLPAGTVVFGPGEAG